MIPTKFNRSVDVEDTTVENGIKIYGNLQSFASEIQQNWKRLWGLLGSVWVLISYYICMTQCRVQAYLWSIEEYLRSCEADISYDPSIFSRVWCRRHIINTKDENGCICGSDARNISESYQRFAKMTSSWLRRNGFHVSFDDVTLWNDGTLLWEVLKRVSRRSQTLQPLSPGDRQKNWSLIGGEIKRMYPGLIQREVLLHCLVASDKLQISHVMYILSRIMYASKRKWRATGLRFLVKAINVLGRVLRPRFTVTGPGMSHAKVNLRNEFLVRTSFPCPSFSVQVQDSSGEIWRENTENARVIARHSDQFNADAELANADRPIDIIKVSMHLYKIYYIVRAKGDCLISIMPGTHCGGHVYGSPFVVPADGASYGNHYTENRKARKRSTPIYPCDEVQQPENHRRNGLKKRLKKQENGHLVKNEKPEKHNNSENDASIAVEAGENAKTPRNSGKMVQIKTDIARHMSSAFTAFSRILNRHSWKGGNLDNENNEKAEKRRKRRTLDTAYSLSGRPASTTGFPMSQSRKLRIKKVIIHRYLNKAMPSLEEYFLGKDFSVDVNDNIGVVGEKQERSIFRLLRKNIASSSVSSAPEPWHKPITKRLSAQELRPRRRTRKLRREENVYIAPWQRSRHSRDGSVRYGSVRKRTSSSSSESGCDVFDDDVIPEEDTDSPTSNGHIRKVHYHSLPSLSTHSLLRETADFRSIVESNESGVAELILGAGMENPRRSPHSKTLARKRRTQGASFDAMGTKLERSASRNRRSGYTIVKQQSTISEPDIKVVQPCYINFADKAVNELFKAAVKEYSSCSSATS